MSPMMQVPMEDRQLPSELQLGPMVMTNASELALEELYWQIGENDITIRLSAQFSSDSKWRGAAMVVAFFYRFPPGRAEFERTVAQYRSDEVESVSLPERVPFGSNTLNVLELDDGWKSDCFAVAPRNLFHIYESESAGVMIRWFAQRGTMLDHPLLSVVRNQLRLIPGQWINEPPQTRQVVDAASHVDDDEGESILTNLDLRPEQARVREYIEARIGDYVNRDNFGPGDPASPIRLITLAFYAEQGGYVTLVFDTRDDAACDGEWTLFIEDDVNMLDAADWRRLYEAIFEEHAVTLTRHDGAVLSITNNDINDEEINAAFGDMLADTAKQLLDEGVFAKLPLSDDAQLFVEEFDGRYFWPRDEDLEKDA